MTTGTEAKSADSGRKPLVRPWIETPLIESAALSRRLGCRVFLKLENLQPSGSFKFRNIGGYLLHAISSRVPGSPIHFYTSSGGNAGLAAVQAALVLGYPCTVVVPSSTKPMMVDKLRVAGARAVIQEGQSWVHADRYLREEVMKGQADAMYVPPFDHETIWEAASGIVEESERQLVRWCAADAVRVDGSASGKDSTEVERVAPDVLVCSVGGGGLFSGIALGVERSAVSSKARIIASETIGADSLNASVDAGEHVTLPGITSIATSLGAVKVCAKAYEYATSGKVDVETVRVTDAQAVRACRLFVEEERMLVEPACGAALAPLYEGILQQKVDVKPDTKVVVVVCGGANISLELLETWSREHPVSS